MSVGVSIPIWPEWQIEGKPLGKGSFGVVYKAVRRDHNVESYAAIKAISIPADPSEVDSLRSEGLDLDGAKTYLHGIVDDFVGEIQLMESLKGGQNIVGVEDYAVVEKTDEIGWDIYIRMELLTPFNNYLCDKTLTEEEVIKLGSDICTALEICSKRDIIHRDIKPENIFVNDFGDFKLGDFGIARKMENMSTGLSQKGTFNYMAPEVANSTDYDARVDTYSLGLVLYRLLNGNRLPFLDTEKQLLNPNERRNAVDRRIRGEELPAPCEASAEMADVILRACAYNPNLRFASATEMKQALMSVANGTYQMENAEELDKTTRVRKAPAKAPLQEKHTVRPQEEIWNDTGKKRKAKKLIAFIGVPVLLLIIASVIVLLTVVMPKNRYNQAISMMDDGNHQEALTIFEALGDYQDSADRIIECKYYVAVSMMNEGNFQEAMVAFEALGEYQDSASKVIECKYHNAVAMMGEGKYQEAQAVFEALGEYQDSTSKIIECKYHNAVAMMGEGKYQEAQAVFEALGEYQDTANKIIECKYHNAVAMMNAGKYQEAQAVLETLGDHQDSANKIIECKYHNAVAMMDAGKYQEALAVLETLGVFRDSTERILECKYQKAIALLNDNSIVKAYDVLVELDGYKDSKAKIDSIYPAYQRIKGKSKIFQNGRWASYGEKEDDIYMSMNILVLDNNTVEISIYKDNTVWIHGMPCATQWYITAKWDETSGRLKYENGGKGYGQYLQELNYEYEDGTGYFYYQDGALHWVDNKENAGKGYNFTPALYALFD